MKKLSTFTLCILTVIFLTLTVQAHPGRTDANGGHYDHSTGEYHYHHGYPAHQHTNGKCPYNFDDKTSHDGGGNSNGISGIFFGNSSNNSSSNSSDDSWWGWLVLIAIIIIILVVRYNMKSSSNEQKSSVSMGSVSSSVSSSSQLTLLSVSNQENHTNGQHSSGTSRPPKPPKKLCTAPDPKDKQIESLKIEASILRMTVNQLKRQIEVLKHQNTASVPSNDSKLQKQIQELSAKVNALASENNRLKSENAALDKQYNIEIAKLNQQANEKNYSDNLIQCALQKMEKGGDRLFYSYPSMLDFYRQVTDKRFHRAMIEDINFADKVTVQAPIRSASSTYNTSLSACTCIDFQRTRKPCKHMLFLAYHTGVLFIHKDQMENSMKVYLDVLRDSKPKK